MALVLALVCGTLMAVADSFAAAENDAPGIMSSEPFLLAPPVETSPVVVRARFDLYDVNEINDENETFEFTGVFTLKWNDPRQAFDPAVVGVDEKVFQGDYQFNELSTGWYPQLVLVNESGLYQVDGVVLRVKPDGTSTLIQMLNAVAETDFNMRRYPLDEQHLEAIFEVLGFDRDEVLLQVESDASSSLASEVRIPHWIITGANLSVRDHSASYAGRQGVSSAFVMSIDVQRDPFYLGRLVTLPLIIIVLLSFSVFWMEKSSLGDRVSVSFIGILTGVTYQIVMSDKLPSISYATLMHGFLGLSFLTMCATVVINLVVGALDQQGKSELADRNLDAAGALIADAENRLIVRRDDQLNVSAVTDLTQYLRDRAAVFRRNPGTATALKHPAEQRRRLPDRRRVHDGQILIQVLAQQVEVQMFIAILQCGQREILLKIARVALNLRVSPHGLCFDIEHPVRQETFETKFAAFSSREPGALVQ